MLAGDLISCADAPGTQVNADRQSIYFDGRRLYIGKPGPSGMLFGVADSVAKAQSFATHITFDSQFITSLDRYFVNNKQQ